MNKLFLLFSIALVACSSRPAWKDAITENTTYKLNPVSVTLNSKCPNNGYLSQKELEKEFDDGIRKVFCEEKTCVDKMGADSVSMNVAVKYSRTFMGEAIDCNASYGSSSVNYSFDLKRSNGDVIYSRPQSGEMMPARGLFNNIGRIATQLTFSGDNDQEKEDLKYFKPGIAKQILKDLK